MNNPYRNLWLATIAQILEDYKADKLRASYLTSKDFVMVCALASLNPVGVLKANKIKLVPHQGMMRSFFQASK